MESLLRIRTWRRESDRFRSHRWTVAFRLPPCPQQVAGVRAGQQFPGCLWRLRHWAKGQQPGAAAVPTNWLAHAPGSIQVLSEQRSMQSPPPPHYPRPGRSAAAELCRAHAGPGYRAEAVHAVHQVADRRLALGVRRRRDRPHPAQTLRQQAPQYRSLRRRNMPIAVSQVASLSCYLRLYDPFSDRCALIADER